MDTSRKKDEIIRRFNDRLAFIGKTEHPLMAVSYDLGEILNRPMKRSEIVPLWEKYFRDLKEQNLNHKFHVYVHSPFCRSKCRYCNCVSRPLGPDDNLGDYVSLVAREAELYSELSLGYPASSIYFGGGTVTLYRDGDFERLLESVIPAFKRKEDAQITCEMNPDSTTERKMEAAVRLGVNRVSFGVQSMTPEVLRRANRAYQTREMVEKAVRIAQSRGIVAINTDVIAFLDGETEDSFAESLRALALIRPNSINLYRYLPVYSSTSAKPGNMLEGYDWGKTVALFRETLKPLDYNVPHENINPYNVGGTLLNSPILLQEDTGVFAFTPRSTLGLGACAQSFILCRAAYRRSPEITPPEETAYMGHLTDPETEARLALTQFCMAGSPVAPTDFKRVYGSTPEEFFSTELETIEELGMLRRDNGCLEWTTPGLHKAIATASVFYTDDEFEKFTRVNASIFQTKDSDGDAPRHGLPDTFTSVLSTAPPAKLEKIAALLGLAETDRRSEDEITLKGADQLIGDTIQIRLLQNSNTITVWLKPLDGKPAFAVTEHVKIMLIGEGIPAPVADWMTILKYRIKGKTWEELNSLFFGASE